MGTARLLLAAALFGLLAGLAGLQPFFTALGAVCGALHQLGTDELQHCLLGAVALARTEAGDPGKPSVALAEARTQSVEQLFHRGRRPQEPGGLAARMQR